MAVYDPIRDEKKPMSLAEFEKAIAECIAEYADGTDGLSDWKKSTHTFDEWMNSLRRFISW